MSITPEYPTHVGIEYQGKVPAVPPNEKLICQTIQEICEAALQRDNVKQSLLSFDPSGPKLRVHLTGNLKFPTTDNAVGSYTLIVAPYYNGVNKIRVVWDGNLNRFENTFPVMINDKRYVMTISGIENKLFTKK